MLKENILKPIMVRSIKKFDSFSSSSDQVDIVAGLLVNNLECFNTFQPFSNRICSMRWIPRRPNTLLVGGKHGELCLIPDVERYTISGNDEENVDMITNGIGPGGEIREIIPDKLDNHMFYSLNVSGELVKVNVSTHDITVIHPHGNFNIWFAGLNVHFDKQIIFMGDNKGNVHLLPDSTRSGKSLPTKVSCHKPGKVNHIEFHPRDPNLMLTAATSDCCVKIWDIRMLQDMQCLATLDHSRGVNSCYFNRSGHKFVTTDQGNELRVYSSGDWNHIATVNHPHRQYQYITPIRAEWHPLADLIVVGKFPNDSKGTKTIDFFDGRDGSAIHSFITPNGKICSLNRFNYTGDILASMFQSEISIWKQKGYKETKLSRKKANLPKRKRKSNESDDSDGDGDSDDEDKKKVKKTAPKAKKAPAKRKVPPRNPKKKG